MTEARVGAALRGWHGLNQMSDPDTALRSVQAPAQPLTQGSVQLVPECALGSARSEAASGGAHSLVPASSETSPKEFTAYLSSAFPAVKVGRKSMPSTSRLL